jgi:hypothetical protein
MHYNIERRRFDRGENAHTLGMCYNKEEDSLIARERVCVMAKGKKRASIEGIKHVHP